MTGERNMKTANHLSDVSTIMLDYAATTGLSPPGKTYARHHSCS